MLRLGDSNMSDSREILVQDPDDDVIASSTPDVTSLPATSRDHESTAEVKLDVRGLSAANNTRTEVADVAETQGDNAVSM